MAQVLYERLPLGECCLRVSMGLKYSIFNFPDLFRVFFQLHAQHTALHLQLPLLVFFLHWRKLQWDGFCSYNSPSPPSSPPSSPSKLPRGRFPDRHNTTPLPHDIPEATTSVASTAHAGTSIAPSTSEPISPEKIELISTSAGENELTVTSTMESGRESVVPTLGSETTATTTSESMSTSSIPKAAFTGAATARSAVRNWVWVAVYL